MIRIKMLSSKNSSTFQKCGDSLEIVQLYVYIVYIKLPYNYFNNEKESQ